MGWNNVYFVFVDFVFFSIANCSLIFLETLPAREMGHLIPNIPGDPKYSKVYSNIFKLLRDSRLHQQVEESAAFDSEHSWEWSAKNTGIGYELCGAWISKGFAWCQKPQEQPPGVSVKLHTSHMLDTWWKPVEKDGTAKGFHHSMQWRESKWQLTPGCRRWERSMALQQLQTRRGTIGHGALTSFDVQDGLWQCRKS